MRDYAHNFPYTDLYKDKTFVGFESGIMCQYPYYYNIICNTTTDKKTSYNSCTDNQWYADTYRDGKLLESPE